MNAKILIQEHNIQYHRYATVIHDIRDLLALPWSVALLHTLREGNMCADHLAKLGASGVEKLCVFDTPPPGLQVFLASDAARIAFPRGYPNADLLV